MNFRQNAKLPMRTTIALLTFFFCQASQEGFAQDIPRTVTETWADYDPHAEPLEVEVVREESGGGIITRYVRYVAGTFAGKKTKVAAFYAFPEKAKALPGIIQVHGGGQFARKQSVQFYAARGYAAIAVNWGEKVIDQADDPNTDWQGIPAGFLDPKHHNGVEASEGTIHRKAHPWNSSWILYAAATRRAAYLLLLPPREHRAGHADGRTRAAGDGEARPVRCGCARCKQAPWSVLPRVLRST